MAISGPSLSVHVKITVDPSDIDAFLKALQPTYDAVIAEPLNTFFEVYQDARTPGIFKLVENWDASVEYMRTVQEKKEYYKAYFETTRPMYKKPLELEIYTRMPGNKWVSVKKDAYPGRE
ncbi:hypothetical protein B0J12DRAFT_746956 [Macrophomina phaseolina]|uniref:ABM domain-containing protein n=1 Tax=Macrophomina phaseolina TaxID=35725 RepID=A0ABQ8FR46_9PEZI|nr:hypothetical protein B0J12DRAFT_746956 [Macrophomina phaseolina]